MRIQGTETSAVRLCITILAILFAMAPTLPGFAQDTYHVSIDGNGNLVIEDQVPGGTADDLIIDKWSGPNRIVILDLTNTLVFTGGGVAQIVNDHEIRISPNQITGSILVNMADGNDAIRVGLTDPVPFDVEVQTTGDLEIKHAAVDAGFSAQASDIMVSVGGILTLNGGNVELTTTTSTVDIDAPIQAEGDLTIKASIVNQDASVTALGTLRILQIGDNVSSLTLNVGSDLDAGVEIIIGSNMDGGDVTIGSSGFPFPLIADVPLTIQTRGTLTLWGPVLTVPPSHGSLAGVANADLTLRGNEIIQHDDILAAGTLRALQPGDGITSLTLLLGAGEPFDAGSEIIVGLNTDAGDVTLGPSGGSSSPLIADVPIALQTMGTLTLNEDVMTVPPAHYLLGVAGADVTLRGNEVVQHENVLANGTLKILQPGDGSTSLTLLLAAGRFLDAGEEIVIGLNTDGGDVTLGPPGGSSTPLIADVPITLQTLGTLTLNEAVLTVPAPHGPRTGIAAADLTLRGHEVFQHDAIIAAGTLKVLQPGNGSTSLGLFLDSGEILDAGVEIVVGLNTDGGDVTLGASAGPPAPLVADVPITLQTLGTLTLWDPVFTVPSPHGPLPGIAGPDLKLRGNVINKNSTLMTPGTLHLYQPGDGSTPLALHIDGSPLTAAVAIKIGDEADGGDVTIDGSNLLSPVDLYIRSGGSVDFSSTWVGTIPPKPIRIVGGGAGLGSTNLMGGIGAASSILIEGRGGDDSFTFGGTSQTLDIYTVSPISFDGMGGEDTMILDDAADPDDNDYNVTAGTFERNTALPTINFVNLERLEINGGEGADELVVDYSSGDPLAALTNGLDFDGGSQPAPKAASSGDVLTLTGGTVSPVGYTFFDENSGEIDLDGSILTYAGLEPITDNLNVADRVFTFSASDDNITLSDDGDAADGESFIDSDFAENVTFTNPTSSLTVNGGDGNDSITFPSLDANFSASVPVLLNGNDGADTFLVTPRIGITTVDGGDPTSYPGDVLDLDLSGGALISSFTGPFDGSWTFDAHSPISFLSIEEQIDLSDVDVDIVADELVPTVGSTVIYTITVVNIPPSHTTGLEISIPFVLGQRLIKSVPSQGSYDLDSGIWDIGELVGSEVATLELHAQIRVFREITMYVEEFAVNEFDPNSTPNNLSTTENDDDSVTLTPKPPATPGPTDFFTPYSVEGTSFATLAVSPNGPSKTGGESDDYLFAGSTDGGLHRSTDGGANWPRVGLKDKVIRAMSISSLTGAVYVGDYGEGMYRSTDDGLTFTVINSGLTNKRVITSVIDEDNATGSDGDVYVGTDAGGVFLSTNNGSTWSAVNTGLTSKTVRALAVHKDAGAGSVEVIYAGTLGGGVFRMEEGSGTWMKVNGTDPVKIGDKYVYALAISQTGALFAGAGDGIYKTADQGANWSLVKAGVPIRSLTTYFDAATSTEYIFAGTDGEYIFVSTNDGSSWTQQLIGVDDRTVETILVTEDGVAFAGTATQGILRSDDLGATWYRVSSFMQNATIQAMAFNDDGELYVGTYGYGIFFTDDAMNFTRVNTGLENHWVFSLAYTPGDAIFAGTWNRGVYRSIDEARTWQFVGLPHRNVYDLAVRDAYTIYAATDRGEVARSVDNGLSWHQVGVATTAIYALGLHPTSPSVIYAGTFGQGTYKSVDGGSTFTKTGMVDTHVFDFAFDPITGDLWAATSYGPMVSSDGGTTWTTTTTGLDVADSRAIAFNDTGTLLVGTWGGGVSSYNFIASSWEEFGLTEMPILAFAISPTTGELVAGTDGAGLFRRTFPAIVSRERGESSEMPAEFALGQNYPNPFNPTTSIAFDLPQSGHVRVAVYDLVGREVRVLAEGTLNAGRHQVEMNASDIPSGVYVYRLEADGRSFSKKMILMK